MKGVTDQDGSAGKPGLLVHFSGDPKECDFCGRPLFDEHFFADAELPGHHGTWGTLCRVCTTSHGIRPGWGRAQFYQRSSSELPWLCSAGMDSNRTDKADNTPCG